MTQGLPCCGALVMTVLVSASVAGIAACSREAPPLAAETTPPFVRTVVPRSAGGDSLLLSGTVRARQETPLAFQIGGRIASRHADAGDAVSAGQLLFRIDPRDLAAAVQAAAADEAAARAALAIAVAERERSERLLAQGFVSRQALDRAALVEREAKTRVEAAQARAQQAGNALGYGELRAASGGVLAEVSGEAGQVVLAGQTVATLARAGEREIEVFLPDGLATAKGGAAPASGELLPVLTAAVPAAGQKTIAAGTATPASGSESSASGGGAKLVLREVAGAADARSRTWRARYRIADRVAGRELRLGSVVRVRFALAGGAGALTVPLGALDERGGGPRVWLLAGGKVEPLPVRVLAIDGEAARIAADLPPDAPLVALGTHLLQPGMAVRELPR